MAESWSTGGNSDVHNKLYLCAGRLRTWSSAKPKDFTKEIAVRRERMKDLIAQPPSVQVLDKIRAVDIEIDEFERREETYWVQRSRQNWLRDGDKYGFYLHSNPFQNV